MSTILDTIAAHARERVAADRRREPLEQLMAGCAEPGGGAAFYDAVRKPGLSFICEIKRASPSKGLIDPVFDYLSIARDYEAAGADCVSCLTEPKWFLGSDGIFADVRREIALPMLRKDFVVDEYQIYQAKALGADCVLLICALHDAGTIARWLELCDGLGLAALVEAHDAREIDMAAAAGAKMIGVNNRNLKDFSVDFSNAARLRERIPANALYVAESGVRGPEDTRALRNTGADAVLVGEALMRAFDIAAALRAMREAAG